MYCHKGELFLLDLSVPRNIDPQVSKLDKVHLYHMDDLNLLIQDNINLKAQSVNQAENLIASTATQIKLELNALDATAAIQSYQQYNQNIANTLLTIAYKELEQAKDAKEIIDKFAHQLTNKLSHDIYILLKQAAKIGNKELLQLIDDLLIKQPASNLEQ
jgi:glutamyl-tRNA reductase